MANDIQDLLDIEAHLANSGKKDSDKYRQAHAEIKQLRGTEAPVCWAKTTAQLKSYQDVHGVLIAIKVCKPKYYCIILDTPVKKVLYISFDCDIIDLSKRKGVYYGIGI